MPDDRNVTAERAAFAKALVTAHQETAVLVDVLLDLVRQTVAPNADGAYDSMFITAAADAMRALIHHGAMVGVYDDGGREVIATLADAKEGA